VESTDVQDVQENVAMEDGGSWFTVKGTQQCTIENSVKNRQTDLGGGGI
jgi:hypothetical protein